MGVRQLGMVACGVALVGTLAGCQSVQSAEARDPARIVLDGVRASRLQLREGHIKFHVRDELPRDSREVEYTLEIDWKDDSLRSTERFASTVGRCAIRHNGELLFRQEPREAFLDDPARGFGYLFLFDPRLFGAHPYLSSLAYAGQFLFFPSDGWQATIAKDSEAVDGRECVVVRWGTQGVIQKYWIDQGQGFRVRRIYDYNNQTRFECTYSGGMSCLSA